MKKVTLTIKNSAENRKIRLEDELSFGRTNLAQEILADSGLSRLNTTFFRDGDEVLVVDENSLNGTFVNGEKISGKPKILADGDEIKIGSETYIRLEIKEDFYAETQNDELPGGAKDFRAGNFQPGENAEQQTTFSNQNPISKVENPESGKPPFILIAAGLATFGIVFLGLIGYLIASRYQPDPANRNGKPTPQIIKSSVIPVRVIDPLGGEDENDLDDLISSWEVEEEELNANDVEEIKVTADKGTSDLKVSRDFFEQQRNKSLNHAGAAGAERAGLITTPEELFGGGVPKQKAKLAELIRGGKYKQPLDFADLAELRLNGTLVEMPWATESYVLDVGGSAGDGEFNSYDFDNGSQPIAPGSEKYKILQRLADNFDGQKYDLDKSNDRKQMRMRLLRMYNANSRKIFEEICNAYYQKFKVPLRVTSMTRSMDYQISLNKTNANSFKVSGKGSLPPHTSGCAFDMSRKNLSAEEQNFMMTLLASMERVGKLDSLREGAANACFHTFIYPDGIEPK